MADPQFIERAVLQVGGIDLDDIIIDVAEQAEFTLKESNTMNKGDVVKGFKQGNSKYTLNVKAERIIDARVPNWHELGRTKKYFKIQLRYSAGPGRTYERCRVQSVKDSTSEGDSQQDIVVRACRRKDG